VSGRPRTERDARRRALGQNFLVDRHVIERFVRSLDLRAGDVVVELGAGTGALTLPLLGAGVEVWAVERDPVWSERLRQIVETRGAHGTSRVIEADLRRLRLPPTPFRVVANPPFGLTTEILTRLLDAPDRGPDRIDLIVQLEVAVKHSRRPPASLRTAAWAPWWEFHLGPTIDRGAFRPRPRVDAAALTIVRRNPPVLPTWLAPRLRELLRPTWTN
jgi:23S rRNA (adenine-N6)-dimethyltransferase